LLMRGRQNKSEWERPAPMWFSLPTPLFKCSSPHQIAMPRFEISSGLVMTRVALGIRTCPSHQIATAEVARIEADRKRGQASRGRS